MPDHRADPPNTPRAAPLHRPLPRRTSVDTDPQPDAAPAPDARRGSVPPPQPPHVPHCPPMSMPVRPLPHPPAAVPADQAAGLRALFGHGRTRHLPLVHNPFVPAAGVVMERLCVALSEHGLNTLVVDAAETAPAAHELAAIDLAACVEPLSPQVSYLAARGLPRRFLDNRATMVGLLDAVHGAAPQAQVVVVHASASDLRRIFAGRAPRPLLLAGERPDSLTDAYASMKLLGQWLGALAFDLVIVSGARPKGARRIAERLGECADLFLGSALHHCAVVDPLTPAQAAPTAALRRMVAAQLAADDRPQSPALMPATPAGARAAGAPWPAAPLAAAPAPGATTRIGGRHEFPVSTGVSARPESVRGAPRRTSGRTN